MDKQEDIFLPLVGRRIVNRIERVLLEIDEVEKFTLDVIDVIGERRALLAHDLHHLRHVMALFQNLMAPSDHGFIYEAFIFGPAYERVYRRISPRVRTFARKAVECADDLERR